MRTKFIYDGGLPADSDTVTLFSTRDMAGGTNLFARKCIDRLSVAINNDQDGTLKAYYSTDAGGNWTQCYSDDAVAAVTSNEINRRDYLVGEFPDFKLEWVNGGTTQGTFDVFIEGIHERSVAD